MSIRSTKSVFDNGSFVVSGAVVCVICQLGEGGGGGGGENDEGKMRCEIGEGCPR